MRSAKLRTKRQRRFDRYVAAALLIIPALPLWAGFCADAPIVNEAPTSRLRITTANQGNLELGEVISDTAASQTSWESIYSAYSCVVQEKYNLVNHWLLQSLKDGAGSDFLKACRDRKFLTDKLQEMATKKKQAPPSNETCEILQAMMMYMGANKTDSIDLLQRILMKHPQNNDFSKLKIQARKMKFQLAGGPYSIYEDTIRVGGNKNHPLKWKNIRLPLRVYIPSDAAAQRVKGYSTGDGLLLRSAFEIWQQKKPDKLKFVFQPTKDQADITCVWESDQKELKIKDAIGVCMQTSDGYNNFTHAEVRVLTFGQNTSWAGRVDNNLRNRYIKDTCLHEIGHSLGLEHSATKSDLMAPVAQTIPLSEPTLNDLQALTELYSTNGKESLADGLDCLDVHRYSEAFAKFDQALVTKTNNSNSRMKICSHLNYVATTLLHFEDYKNAVLLLEKAHDIASNLLPDSITVPLTKNLHYAYLQSGHIQEARNLEQSHSFLQTKENDSASLFNQYGSGREALPHYEEALAKEPDNDALRNRYCIFLVMLARDEASADRNNEAISLLLQAKALLRPDAPSDMIEKVMGALYDAYVRDKRYDEADQARRDEAAMTLKSFSLTDRNP